MDSWLKKHGGDVAFCIFMSIAVGCCTTCHGLDRWRAVERDRHELRLQKLNCAPPTESE
jgi:hypothetical protein